MYLPTWQSDTSRTPRTPHRSDASLYGSCHQARRTALNIKYHFTIRDQIHVNNTAACSSGLLYRLEQTVSCCDVVQTLLGAVLLIYLLRTALKAGALYCLLLITRCNPLITLTFHTRAHARTHTAHIQFSGVHCRVTNRHYYSHKPQGAACNLLLHSGEQFISSFLSSHINLSGRPSVRRMIVGDIKITRHLWPHFVEVGTKIHCWRSLCLVTLYVPEICNLNMVTGQTYEVLTTQGPGTINCWRCLLWQICKK